MVTLYKCDNCGKMFTSENKIVHCKGLASAGSDSNIHYYMDLCYKCIDVIRKEWAYEFLNTPLHRWTNEELEVMMTNLSNMVDTAKDKDLKYLQWKMRIFGPEYARFKIEGEDD